MVPKSEGQRNYYLRQYKFPGLCPRTKELGNESPGKWVAFKLCLKQLGGFGQIMMEGGRGRKRPAEQEIVSKDMEVEKQAFGMAGGQMR